MKAVNNAEMLMRMVATRNFTPKKVQIYAPVGNCLNPNEDANIFIF